MGELSMLLWDWSQIGTNALLSIGVILILTGRLVWAKSTDRLEKSWEARLDEKEQEKKDIIKAYETNQANLVAYYDGQRLDAIQVNDMLSKALTGSIHNNSKLIAQGDELMQLARLITPTVLTQQNLLNRMVINEEE